MSLTLAHYTPSDAPELAEAMQAAFERTPRFEVMYKNVPRETLVKRSEEKYRKGIAAAAAQAEADGSNGRHYLKVSDAVTDEITSFAIWEWLPDGYRAEEDEQVVAKGVSALFWKNRFRFPQKALLLLS